jgi:hypothetical protein
MGARKGGRNGVYVTKTQFMQLRRGKGRPVTLRMTKAQHRHNLKYGRGVWAERAKAFGRAMLPKFKKEIWHHSKRLGNYLGSHLDEYGLGDVARKAVSHGTSHLYKKAMGGSGMRKRRRKSRKGRGIYL